MPASNVVEPWSKVPVPQQAAATCGLVDAGRIKLSYWDTGGAGEVVVLNHPRCQGSECWAYQQPAFAAAGYRVVAWSRRGTDATPRGPDGDPATAADDLRSLLDGLGIDACHLLGAAEGAAAVVHFALEHPARVRSAVLLGARLFVDEDDYRAMSARARLADNHRAEAHFFEVGPSYRGAHPEGVAAWKAISAAAHPDGVFDAQRWGAKPLTWKRLAQCGVPVLLLNGDADHYSSAAYNRLLAQHLPNRELAMIDEAGASAYWEQPDAFNAAVLDFLGRHRAGRSDPPPAAPKTTSSAWLDLSSSRATAPAIWSGSVRVWNEVPVPEQVPATEGFADTKPVKIWFWDTGGEGEAIIFCHPWSQSSECWKYQQPVFAKAGYRVIAWCQRGFLKTERGPEDDPGSSSADLQQLVEYLGLERFHLVGCAAGGCTAVSYAINHPARLYSLTLSGTILLPEEQEYRAFRSNLDAAPAGVDTNVPVDFREVGASYRAGNPAGYEEWRTLGEQSRPNGFHLTQPWGARRDWHAFAKLTMPVLLQTGDTDMSAPPALLRIFARHFPNCEQRILREAGHAAYWEQPEAFNASLLDFIQRNGAAARPRDKAALLSAE